MPASKGKAGGAYGITLTTTSYTPTNTQLGYYTYGELASTQVTYFASFPGTSLATISGIPIGTYMLVVSYVCSTWSVSTMTVQFGTTITNGTSQMFMGKQGASTATTGDTTGSYTGYLSITSSTGTVLLTGKTSSAGTTVNAFTNVKIFRIA